MKKTSRVLSVMLLLLLCVSCVVGCGKEELPAIWQDAMYSSDVELGEGSTTFTVQVKAEDRQVTFTIHTDKTVVGDALMEHGLLEGEKQSAGMYLKKVNGMVADWEEDQTYWAFYIDDAYAMTGVDQTNIEAGVIYRLERTK